jgi:hypothetical protein
MVGVVVVDCAAACADKRRSDAIRAQRRVERDDRAIVRSI